MRRFVALLLVLPPLAAAPACGGGGDPGGAGGEGGLGPAASGRCDEAHCATGEGAGDCAQYADDVVSLDYLQQACADDGGTWSAGGCPTHGSGGCRRRDGTLCRLQWFGEGFDRETIEGVCMNSGGTFIEP